MQHDSTTLARFWAKVDKTGDCWLWTAAHLPTGYGIFNFSRSVAHRRIYAHRLSYILAHGAIPEGMVVCHRCDNPSCVNPAHLFVGTQAENLADAKRKGRVRSGARHGMAKLTEQDVREIRAARADGLLLREIAARYGVTFQAVSDICRGKWWREGAK